MVKSFCLAMTLVICIGAVTACQTGASELNRVPGVNVVLGVQCVDAVGPNSSREQIAEAQLAREVKDPQTGQFMTDLDLSLRQLQDRGTPRTADEIRQLMLERVFPADPTDPQVPEGGDAAYAAAICGLHDGWPQLGLLSEDEARVAGIPHLLRSTGRSTCGAASVDTSAEASLQAEKERADDAAADPGAFKAMVLKSLDQQIANASSLPPDSPLFNVTSLEAMRAELHAKSPEDIVAGLELALRISWLAIEHQCPSLSRYGFGPECGEINPYPDGDSTGILMMKGDAELTCEQAALVIRWHNLPSEADQTSLLASYVCRTGDIAGEDAAPVLIECLPFRGATDRPIVFVKPLD